jgi:formylglycine-generating enzyme required for sulfatase activity
MRVIRGGCWANFPWDCRSAARGREAPERRSPYIGFRVVVEGY